MVGTGVSKDVEIDDGGSHVFGGLRWTGGESKKVIQFRTKGKFFFFFTPNC